MYCKSWLCVLYTKWCMLLCVYCWLCSERKHVVQVVLDGGVETGAVRCDQIDDGRGMQIITLLVGETRATAR